MIKLEYIQPDWFSIEAALRGMRNPLDSHAKSDSRWVDGVYNMGDNDQQLMIKLCKAGTTHRKYMRSMGVTVDITAPLYWWKEFDTYKVGTVANSESTMHTIHKKPFSKESFSFDHIDENSNPTYVIDLIITALNCSRDQYLKTKDKKYWWEMIQLLPSSYNQKRTVSMNYEVVYHMIQDRKNHKLDEWIEFCKTMSNELPYMNILLNTKDESML